MPSQRGFTSEAGSKGDRDPNILVSSDGLKLSMLISILCKNKRFDENLSGDERKSYMFGTTWASFLQLSEGRSSCYVKAKANSEHDNSVRMRGVITFPVLISHISFSTGNHVICFLPGVDYKLRTASHRPHCLKICDILSFYPGRHHRGDRCDGCFRRSESEKPKTLLHKLQSSTGISSYVYMKNQTGCSCLRPHPSTTALCIDSACKKRTAAPFRTML
ncbi:uncharacterized protein LOC130090900 [Rhinichthys klamathensis goyatoka]|uniref:uncharacterized protein LOC130090900 n=1 Tax=Rhinichthys klamathensis goyatoka TaxID=3034132 RepID=UPI0024B555C7|nr:uncharacterized protein LOC130090900 [Rhinichthys klamathensis goyatoka]